MKKKKEDLTQYLNKEINIQNMKRGLINGEVQERNHRKMQRGLTNGEGRGGFTNGAGKKKSGFTNGMVQEGLVNGAGQGGFTNGMVSESLFGDKTPTIKRKPNRTKQTIALGTIFILCMTMFIYANMIPVGTSNIDGEFSEYNNSIDLQFAKMDIIKNDNHKMLIHLNKQNMFQGDGEKTDSYLIFINDKNSADGFLLGYDTYEYYIEIYGTNNELERVTGYQFDSNRPNYDWNGFSSRYSTFSLKRAWGLNDIEIELRSVNLGRTNLTDIEFLVYHYYPNTNFEYSQVVNVDAEAKYGEFEIGTRTDYMSYFTQNLVNRTLKVNTIHSMAYSYLPYSVKLVKEPIPQNNTQASTETPIQTNTTVNNTQNTNVTPTPLPANEVYTNLTIVYTNGNTEIVKQCGGVIISTSIMHVTLNDTGFLFKNIYEEVERCIIDGHFGYQEVYKERTRSGFGDLSINSIPEQPVPMNTIDTLHAHGYNETRDLTIDGVVDDDAWAGEFTCQYVVDMTQGMKLFIQRNDTYLYIAIYYIETSIQSQDSASIYFDTWNAENSSPNNNSYKRIDVNGADTITYYEGSGTGWASTTLPTGWDADAGSSTYGAGTYRTYEFQVPLGDLDTSDCFCTENDTIGIGIKAHDYKTGGGSHSYHIWYPDAWESATTPTTEYMNDPSTWSDLKYLGEYFARDYALDVILNTTTITIDGILNESAYSEDVGCTHIYDAQNTTIGRIGYFRDATYLHIGLCMYGWENKTANDFSEVIFDTDYDQTTTPDAGDKRLQLQSDNTTVYLEGNGVDWTVTTTPTGWVAKSGFTNNNSTWEFQIPLSDLNASGNFWEQGDVIGFMAYMYRTDDDLNKQVAIYFPDGSQTWVSFIPTKDRPDLWGELVIAIPEYDDVLPIIGFMLLVAVVFIRKRKDDKVVYDGG